MRYAIVFLENCIGGKMIVEYLRVSTIKQDVVRQQEKLRLIDGLGEKKKQLKTYQKISKNIMTR